MKKTEIICSHDRLTVIEKTSVSIYFYTDIVGIFCEHPYSMVVATNKNKKLIFYSLKEMKQLLPLPFVMCSRSAIINISHVVQLRTQSSNCCLHLDNGQKIPVSRRKKSYIMGIIKEVLTGL